MQAASALRSLFVCSAKARNVRAVGLVTSSMLAASSARATGPVPATPRADLVSIFLTGITGLNAIPGARACEYMRLNMTTPVAASPNRLGVIAGDNQGFPNGRRPVDDVTDIALRAVAGGTVLTPATNVAPNNVLSDGVDAVDASQPFLTTFPFLADPTPGR